MKMTTSAMPMIGTDGSDGVLERGAIMRLEDLDSFPASLLLRDVWQQGGLLHGEAAVDLGASAGIGPRMTGAE